MEKRPPVKFNGSPVKLYTHYLRGNYLAAYGLLAESRTEMEKAFKEAPWSAELAVRLAEIQLILNDREGAQRTIETALLHSPNHPDLHLLRGRIKLEASDLPAAEASLRRYLELEPRSDEGFFWLGITLLQRGDLEAGRKALQSAAEINPSVPETWERLGLIALHTDRKDEAIEAYQKLIVLDPAVIDFYLTLSDLLVQTGRGAESSKVLEKALGVDPQNIGVLERFVNAALAQEDYDQALLHLERLKKLRPNDDETLDLLLLIYEKTDRFQEGRDLLLEKIEKRGPSVENYGRLAYFEVGAGETAAAIGHLQQAVESDSTRVETRLLLAAVLIAENDYSSAEKNYQEARVLRPDDTEILLGLGFIQDKLGETEPAFQTFLRVIELDPMEARALNYVGFVWADRGENLEQAESYIRRALAVEPENGSYLDSLGWVYYQRGEYELALEWILRAAERTPEDAEIHHHLGDVYFALGRLEEARSSLREALNKGIKNVQLIEKKLESIRGG